jgi:hypothetical protein
MMKSSEKFPLLGFPNETNYEPSGNVVYWCRPVPHARIVVWSYESGEHKYGVNIYHHPQMYEDMLTSSKDRFRKDQEPLKLNDVFEVQLAIFHLIQTLLTEVTENVE